MEKKTKKVALKEILELNLLNLFIKLKRKEKITDSQYSPGSFENHGLEDEGTYST